VDSWSSHAWVPPQGRALEIEGHNVVHFRCEFCKRDFVEELASGERYAVEVRNFGFERLAEEVTGRWLRTRCPKNPAVGDEDDRCTRSSESLAS
jgi:hypothetical protein